MRILLLSDNEYLLGLLKGYCINVGCDVKVIENCNNFYSAINNKTPLLVFIDSAQIPQLLDMAEWQTTQRIIEENNIILCCFGKQSLDNEYIHANSAFKKFFPHPFSEEEILIFLQECLTKKNLLTTERRQHVRRKEKKRRNGTNRRKPLTPIHTTLSDEKQQNSKGVIRIGSLLINRSHKVITIKDIPVNLSHKEFEIIDYLAANSNSVVKTEDIIKNVWAECTRATKADVHQYIHMLRKKIESDPHNPKRLITVRGFGYELRP